MNLTEADLRRTVEAARGGDPDAWETLYRRGLPAVVRLRPAQARHRRAGRGRRERGDDARAAPDLDLRLDRGALRVVTSKGANLRVPFATPSAAVVDTALTRPAPAPTPGTVPATASRRGRRSLGTAPRLGPALVSCA